KEAERWSYGITSDQWSLRPEHFKMIYGCLPPLPEQTAIVRFLDYADRRIRRYIRAKQKLIKLLEEQKQAIIHRAVTRGLDPNVRLKPSGVEWLGDIPEHWEIAPLKFLSCRIQNGATPPTSEPRFYIDGIVPWYGPSSCAQYEEVGKPVRYLTETAFSEGRARLIHAPALLVVVIGATAGRMALLPQDGSTNQQITSYEVRTERVSPRFVLRQVRGAERWLRTTASTATIPILDAGEVSRLPVAVPPLPEQERIVRHAEESTTDLSTAIERAEREISLLREYRTRLIADVVTGKLDVREAAARLPDEAEEPGPLNQADALTDAGEDVAEDLDAVSEEAEEVGEVAQ
ncbi:MAG: restriction endonuclease subunit S, partial [candidate division NC10 bacterium]|nr:restriction endonuclease subunit S [candidate division NC10 bacterium]